MEKLKIKEQLKKISQTVEYDGGSIQYVLFGEPSTEHNPIAVVPGYTEGLVALHNFARDLADDGDRQVLITEQPDVDHSNQKLDPIEHLAESWLSTIKVNGWQNRPVDVVAHSLGAIVFERAAALAYSREWKCFDITNGSKSIFLAPAGTNASESLASMTPRYIKLLQTIVAGSELRNAVKSDNGIEILMAGTNNMIQQPRKYFKEVGPILRHRINYVDLLGKAGLKPFILGYNKDQLFSHNIIGATVLGNLEHTAGYSMPVDKKAAHNDLLYKNLTARAVLQVLDGKVAGIPINR
jgi:hypothetical protein